MIALPLQKEIARCLAHGQTVGEWCHLADNCARHLTLRHDPLWPDGPAVIHYRACNSELMVGYTPLEGFPKADDE